MLFISLNENEMDDHNNFIMMHKVREPPLGADGSEGEGQQRGTARRRVRHLDEPQC